MTKQQLQQELKEKIKEGVKPSDLRKLKRSKSESDLPSPPPLPTNPPRRKSVDLLTPASLTKKFTEATDQISILELKLETKERELVEKDNELNTTKQQLDNSLQARYEAVKKFSKIYAKLQEIRKELNENVAAASSELTNQDQTITKLRTNQSKAQTRIQELERDLNLATKLAQVSKYPLPTNSPNLDYLKYALYLGTLVLISWLLTKNHE